jgi:hypothetical protein
MLARSAIELEHDFQGASEVAKVAVYRKALFRDRNQTIKRTLFTLAPRSDALRGVFQPLNRRKFTLNALNCPIWVSLEPDNSDTFVSLPQGHTYQYQILGPFFLPVYFLNGGPDANKPFEQAANNFAQGGSPDRTVPQS